MFRRHPLKWLLAAAFVGFCLWLRFRTVPERPGDHLKMGLEALASREFSAAERYFRNELRLVPEQPEASIQLAQLLIQSGRSWEAAPLSQTVLQQPKIPPDYLLQIAGDPATLISESMLDDWHRRSPEDYAPLTGLAKIALRNGRTDEAHELLNRILALDPDNMEAHAVKGNVELITNVSRLPEWNNQLPANAALHPGIWFVRGGWCQQAGEPEKAIRCYLEGFRLNPGDSNLNLKLGQLLGEDQGHPFLQRADSLRRIFEGVGNSQNRKSFSNAWLLAELMQSLGRYREAARWGQMAMMSDPRLMVRMTSDSQFAKSYNQIIAAASTGKDFDPASIMSLEGFPEWQPPVVATATGNSLQ